MKLFNIFKKFSKKAKAVAAVAAVAAIAAPIIAVAEFYPVRPTYDYNKQPLNGTTCTVADDADHNRCGSLTGPVFNSFVNTPSYGDERSFLDGRRSDQATNTNADQINDVTKGSQEVVLRTYVHNNANQNTNATIGVAKDARVRVGLPTGTAQVLRARSYISANNAAMVEDTVDLTGTQQFSVEYVPGSAKLLRNTSVYQLSDNIVTTGALIGDKTMDGNLPGCFDYAALVEVKVRIKVASYDLDISKTVRKHVEGQTGNWTKEISVAPNTKVDYLVDTKNGGSAVLNDVTVRDVLPPHVTLVPGSVKFVNGGGQYPQNDLNFFGGGFNTGKYNPGVNTFMIFSAVTKDDFNGCSTKIRNLAYAKSSTTPEITDYADVIITKENCNPVTPKYSCDLLTATKLGDFKFRFNTQYTAKDGATLKSLSYNFGDGSTTNTTNTAVEHTYVQTGTYKTVVTAVFTVNGTDQTVNSPACETTVTVSRDQVTPKYSCDMLTAEKIGDRNYRFTLRFTAQDGATLKFINYTYGDGAKLMTDKTVTEHAYTKDGTYVTRAVVTFNVNGEDKVVDSDKCAAAVTISTPPVTPPTTPGQPTVLPNTGAGNIFGIFAATTLIGAFMHRAYAARKA